MPHSLSCLMTYNATEKSTPETNCTAFINTPAQHLSDIFHLERRCDLPKLRFLEEMNLNDVLLFIRHLSGDRSVVTTVLFSVKPKHAAVLAV